MNREALIDQLIKHEGLVLKPYRDTVGKLTIGVGRNLDDVGISELEARNMLNSDIERSTRDLIKALPWVTGLDDARQNVLINMAFNMGVKGLMTFTNTLALVKGGKFDQAADNMLKSKWASQVGKRATDLANQMRTGYL